MSDIEDRLERLESPIFDRPATIERQPDRIAVPDAERLPLPPSTHGGRDVHVSRRTALNAGGLLVRLAVERRSDSGTGNRPVRLGSSTIRSNWWVMNGQEIDKAGGRRPNREGTAADPGGEHR